MWECNHRGKILSNIDKVIQRISINQSEARIIDGWKLAILGSNRSIKTYLIEYPRKISKCIWSIYELIE